MCLGFGRRFSHEIMQPPSEELVDLIVYSPRYHTAEKTYRHVHLPMELAFLPAIKEKRDRGELLTEDEWRGIGVQQSLGWRHYMWHHPCPHTLLFERELDQSPPLSA